MSGRIQMYARFLRGLRKFLHEPINPEKARTLISDWLASRESRLLNLTRRAIYGHPASPYLPLLKWAGCEYRDFERGVYSDGIEATLQKLADEGVRITIDEFKGRVPVSRGGNAYQLKPADFDNPAVASHIEASTGASRTAGTRTAYDLDFLAESWSVHLSIALATLDAYPLPYGTWLPIMPGAGPVVLLAYSKCGKPPSKWFSQLSAGSMSASRRSRIETTGLVAAGRWLGMPWPYPEYVPTDAALTVARWIHKMLNDHGGCCFNSYTSAAVRVCHAAQTARLDISGAVFLFGGEPLTEAKLAVIKRAGVTRFLMYGTMEAGYLGVGCFSPNAADDVHLLHDTLAFIQQPRYVAHASATVPALLVTSLLATAPKVLLNVETGDYGVQESRKCGCVWEQVGLDRHLHTIRGFDKLTSEGMTFLGSDMLRLLEELLPSVFGGSPADYQMVEEEDPQGLTRMKILVSPGIGEIDEAKLCETVYRTLANGPESHRMMARIWRESNTLQILRRRPIETNAGKINTLHIHRGRPLS